MTKSSFENVEGEWSEEYVVDSSTYRRGRWWRDEAIVVVAQREGEAKSRKLMIPPSTVSVMYEQRDNVQLTLHKTRTSYVYIDFMCGGVFTLDDITRAEFRVPEGYELMGDE